MTYIVDNDKVFHAEERGSLITKGIVLSFVAHTFDNGLIVICDRNMLVELSKKLGLKLRGYYLSETSGLLKISDMNSEHRKNAAMKLIKESELDNKDLILELYGI